MTMWYAQHLNRADNLMIYCELRLKLLLRLARCGDSKDSCSHVNGEL